ncbi:hypothetical protein DUI87_03769 [Hirundo rustica rustica]|uniref:Reverse transcriptase domain-containing protein n=1 Tax=Hirundo rustica rustica TaxID=333673 RepID=A0A3M0L185_HIRRU|nr:hypothetical protein DUI87_03769 [Hirundo rustica rustica]
MVLHPAGGQAPVVSLRGLCWGQFLFNIFIDDMDEGIESLISKFVDDTKLESMCQSLGRQEGSAERSAHLDGWAESNRGSLVSPSAESCSLATMTPLQRYRLGKAWLDSAQEERDLGALGTAAGHEPAVCPGGQEGQWHPGLDQEWCGQQEQGAHSAPVLGTGEATP